MLYGIGISGTGAQIEQTRLEAVSSTLANMRTPGFKRDVVTLMQRPVESADILHDHEFHKAFDAHDLLDLQGGGVQLHDVRVDHSQGALETTGNDLDLALQGQGYFTLEHRQLGRAYTRAGNFTLNAEGDLVTQDGSSFVLDHEGNRINFRAMAQLMGATASRLSVGTDGTLGIVGVDGGAEATGRRIGLTAFADAALGDLEKLGDTLLAPRAGTTPRQVPVTATVRQGALEMSGVEPTALMAQMIEISRAYEANLRMLKIQDTTLGTLIGRVADIPA